MARDKKRGSDKIITEIVNSMNTSMKKLVTAAAPLENVIDFIENEFDIKVKSGQKRAVPIVGDYVLKLVANIEGLDDNINEILTSEELIRLNKKGKITDDELEHFALVEMVDDDPYVIKATRYTLLEDCEDFKEWDKKHKNDDQYKGDTKNKRIGYWILSDKNLNKQAMIIMTIIARFTVSSDNLPWKMVENFAMDEDTKKLVFIDMGSVLPRYKGTEVECSCGAQKSLLVPEVDYRDQGKIDNVMSMKTGLYGCKSENCSDYYKNIKLSKSNNNIIDSVTFDEYQTLVKMNENFQMQRATLANIFIPMNEIESFDDFKDSLVDETGEKFSGEEIRNIWRNSLPFIALDLVDEAMPSIDYNTREYDYDNLDEFTDMFYEEVNKTRSKRNELDDSDILDMYAAIQYINYRIDYVDKGNELSAQVILSSEDKSEFTSYCKSIEIGETRDDEDDIDDLWEILESFIKINRR